MSIEGNLKSVYQFFAGKSSRRRRKPQTFGRRTEKTRTLYTFFAYSAFAIAFLRASCIIKIIKLPCNTRCIMFSATAFFRHSLALCFCISLLASAALFCGSASAADRPTVRRSRCRAGSVRHPPPAGRPCGLFGNAALHFFQKGLTNRQKTCILTGYVTETPCVRLQKYSSGEEAPLLRV